ncbi:MAG: AEC family transporter [Proteobacteria bacterium]|nr:AEC family transporter [Pseudomonadota bacterium]
MNAAVFAKLLGIFATVAIGWFASRRRWLGAPGGGGDPARVLSNAAFYLFVPALLFRTMARIDLARMPWPTLAAYFVPAIGVLLAIYARQRRTAAAHAATPATRTIAATYGNAVQLGIPIAAAVFGEAGLALHIALVSLHGLVMLTLLTVLVELDLARAAGSQAHWDTLRSTVRNALIHPVVLPVVAGLCWNLAGWPLPAVADQTLAMLAAAVVPVCLVLIGVSLESWGLRGQLRGAVELGLLKLLLLPAVVLLAARLAFGVTGTPLAVLAMMAALPTGSNALLFAQRYATREAEATAAIVLSTFAFALTAPLWLALAAWAG